MSHTLQTLYNRIHGKRIFVIGIGVSNTPLIKLLADGGAVVTARDRNENALDGERGQALAALGVKSVLGENYLAGMEDDEIIFRTPGLRYDVPALAAARARGAVVTSEMELFFELCPCPIFGVTGSDGKTTTTTLVYEMLSAQGFRCHKGGNIGAPLLPEIANITPTDIAVVELSSFQLHDMRCSPDVAVITNLSPNHLDYHKDMQEYVDAKKNIFLHQNPNNRLVYNYDNPISRELIAASGREAVPFSISGQADHGVLLRGRVIHYVDGERDEPVLDIGDIRIPGRHNVENYMAAIGAVMDYVDVERIEQVARTFGGVEHRIELVRTLDGVRYYNDSIASSPTRAMAGLNSFDAPLTLIAGGYDKNLDYTAFGRLVNRRVKKLVLVGKSSGKIFDAVVHADNYDPDALDIVLCSNFEQAVRTAAAGAHSGDVVILSPASASFDQFRNFAERGEAFRRIVNAL